MKKILYYIPSIVFNISELIIIYLFGIWLKVPTYQIVLIFLFFVTTRIILRKQLHYKDWYRCLIWSTLVFISFFIVAKASFIVAILMSIFSGYILTQNGDIDIDKIENA